MVIEPFIENELSVSRLPSHRIVFDKLEERLYCLACVHVAFNFKRLSIRVSALACRYFWEWLIQIFRDDVKRVADDVFDGFQREAHALRLHDDVHVFFRETVAF